MAMQRWPGETPAPGIQTAEPGSVDGFQAADFDGVTQRSASSMAFHVHLGLFSWGSAHQIASVCHPKGTWMGSGGCLLPMGFSKRAMVSWAKWMRKATTLGGPSLFFKQTRL